MPQFLTRDVIFGKLLQLFAAQTDFDGFFHSFLFTPALFDDAENHHEGADPIGGSAVNKHRVIGFFFDQSNELVRLFGARRAGYHGNIEVAQPIFFD